VLCHWLLPLEILGMLGPLVGAAISLALAVAGIWALFLANTIFQSLFFSLLISAVERNLIWFFAIPLAMGYCDYFARKFPALLLPLRAARDAVGFVFSIWVLAWLLRTGGALADVALLLQIGSALRESLVLIFALALGYFSLAAHWKHRARMP
jgi:hypothetical protein